MFAWAILFAITVLRHSSFFTIKKGSNLVLRPFVGVGTRLRWQMSHRKQYRINHDRMIILIIALAGLLSATCRGSHRCEWKCCPDYVTRVNIWIQDLCSTLFEPRMLSLYSYDQLTTVSQLTFTVPDQRHRAGNLPADRKCFKSPRQTDVVGGRCHFYFTVWNVVDTYESLLTLPLMEVLRFHSYTWFQFEQLYKMPKQKGGYPDRVTKLVRLHSVWDQKNE